MTKIGDYAFPTVLHFLTRWQARDPSAKEEMIRIFNATSTASEPPVVNRTLARSPGAILVSFFANDRAGLEANRRGANGKASICRVMSSFNLG